MFKIVQFPGILSGLPRAICCIFEITMKKWMSGFRGAVLMIVVWIIVWGLGFGGVIEAFIDPEGQIIDVWPTFLAIPGFIGGSIFSALFLIAERGRGFDEIAPIRFAIWGIATGIVLGLLTIPVKVGDVAPSAVRMTGILIALSLVAAFGSAFFFRVVARWQTPATDH